jgi:hypothetical protein
MKVGRPQGGQPVAIFYPLGHPTPYTSAGHIFLKINSHTGCLECNLDRENTLPQKIEYICFILKYHRSKDFIGEIVRCLHDYFLPTSVGDKSVVHNLPRESSGFSS